MVNNTVLKDLLKEYDKKQQKAVYDMEIRRKELYDRIPRLQEIANELNDCAIQSAKSILTQNNSAALENLQEKIRSLKEEQISILKKDGKTLDYLSPIYECLKCKDTRIYLRRWKNLYV